LVQGHGEDSMEAGMRRWSRWVVALGVCMAGTACAPSLWDRWQGTGERFEGRLFQAAFEFQKKGPSFAVWLDDRGATTRLAVCNLEQGDEGAIQFQVDPETPALDCSELRHPWTVRGRMGGHVWAGDLLDEQGKPIGRIRALRTGE